MMIRMTTEDLNPRKHKYTSNQNAQTLPQTDSNVRKTQSSASRSGSKPRHHPDGWVVDADEVFFNVGALDLEREYYQQHQQYQRQQQQRQHPQSQHQHLGHTHPEQLRDAKRFPKLRMPGTECPSHTPDYQVKPSCGAFRDDAHQTNIETRIPVKTNQQTLTQTGGSHPYPSSPGCRVHALSTGSKPSPQGPRRDFHQSPSTPDEGYSTGTNSTTSISSPLSASLASIEPSNTSPYQEVPTSADLRTAHPGVAPGREAIRHSNFFFTGPINSGSENYTCFSQREQKLSSNPDCFNFSVSGQGSGPKCKSEKEPQSPVLATLPMSIMQRGPIQKGPSLHHLGRKGINSSGIPTATVGIKRRDFYNQPQKDPNSKGNVGKIVSCNSSGNSLSSLEERLRALTTIEEEETAPSLDRYPLQQRVLNQPAQDGSKTAFDQLARDVSRRPASNQRLSGTDLFHQNQVQNSQAGCLPHTRQHDLDLVEATGFFRAVPVQIVQPGFSDHSPYAITNSNNQHSDNRQGTFHSTNTEETSGYGRMLHYDENGTLFKTRDPREPGLSLYNSEVFRNDTNIPGNLQPPRGDDLHFQELPQINLASAGQGVGSDHTRDWRDYQRYFQKEVDIPAHNIDISQGGKFNNNGVPDMDINGHLRTGSMKEANDRLRTSMSSSRTHDDFKDMGPVVFNAGHISSSQPEVIEKQRFSLDDDGRLVLVNPQNTQYLRTGTDAHCSYSISEPTQHSFSHNPALQHVQVNKSFTGSRSIKERQDSLYFNDTFHNDHPSGDRENIHSSQPSLHSQSHNFNVASSMPDLRIQPLNQPRDQQNVSYCSHSHSYDFQNPQVENVPQLLESMGSSQPNPTSNYFFQSQTNEDMDRKHQIQLHELQQQQYRSRQENTLPNSSINSFSQNSVRTVPSSSTTNHTSLPSSEHTQLKAHLQMQQLQQTQQQQQQDIQQQQHRVMTHPPQGFSDLQQEYNYSITHDIADDPAADEPVILRRSRLTSSARVPGTRPDRYSWQPQSSLAGGMPDSSTGFLQRSSLDLGNLPQLQQQIRASSELCLQATRRHMFASSADIYKLFSGQSRKRPQTTLSLPYSPSSPCAAHPSLPSSAVTSAPSPSSGSNNMTRENNMLRHSFHTTSTPSLYNLPGSNKQLLTSHFASPDAFSGPGASSCDNLNGNYADIQLNMLQSRSQQNQEPQAIQSQHGENLVAHKRKAPNAVPWWNSDIDNGLPTANNRFRTSGVSDQSSGSSQIEPCYSLIPSGQGWLPRSVSDREHQHQPQRSCSDTVRAPLAADPLAKFVDTAIALDEAGVEFKSGGLQRQSSGYSSETELQQIETNARAVKKQITQHKRIDQKERPGLPEFSQGFIALNTSADQDSTTTAGTEDTNLEELSLPYNDPNNRRSSSAEPVYMNQIMFGRGGDCTSGDLPPPLPERRPASVTTGIAPRYAFSKNNAPQASWKHLFPFESHSSHGPVCMGVQAVGSGRDDDFQHRSQEMEKQNQGYGGLNSANGLGDHDDVSGLTQKQIINFQRRPVTITSHIPCEPFSQIQQRHLAQDVSRSGEDIKHTDSSSITNQFMASDVYPVAGDHTTNLPLTSDQIQHQATAAQDARCVIISPEHQPEARGSQEHSPPGVPVQCGPSSPQQVGPGPGVHPTVQEGSRSRTNSTSAPMSPVEIAQVLEVPFSTNIISDEQGDRLSTLV